MPFQEKRPVRRWRACAKCRLSAACRSADYARSRKLAPSVLAAVPLQPADTCAAILRGEIQHDAALGPVVHLERGIRPADNPKHATEHPRRVAGQIRGQELERDVAAER